MRLKFCLVFIVLLVALSAGGCYTVLKHPEGAVMADEYQQRRSCGDCHQASWFYHQDPYWYGGYYYGTYHPYSWYDYYGRPWWYDDYWYYSGREGEPVERGTRHMWSPPSLRPPEQINIPPALKVPESKQQGSSTQQTPPEDSKKKEQEEKKKRHLWDR